MIGRPSNCACGGESGSDLTRWSFNQYGSFCSIVGHSGGRGVPSCKGDGGGIRWDVASEGSLLIQ